MEGMRRRAAGAMLINGLLALLWPLGAAGVAPPTDTPRQAARQVRPVRPDDLPPQLQEWLAAQGVTRGGFAAYVADTNRRTAERELTGEYEHLIYYALQSARFTARPPVEPAVSAYQLFSRLDASERARFLGDERDYDPPAAKIPPQAAGRLSDFAAALDKPPGQASADDERLGYFRSFIKRTFPAAGQPLQQFQERLRAEYVRTMRFLYRKEFSAREVSPRQLAAFVARLYEERGHSTDTQIEANFALHHALAVIKAETPEARLERVLIVGPGLDFAPRTSFVDLFGPQSYQPFAVADALVGLKLADADRLSIHCVDINDRVLAHLQGLPARGSVSLALVSGVADSPARPLAADYRDYFRAFGRSIGTEEALEVPPPFASRLHKRLCVRREIAARLSAAKLNIITERYEPSPHYDLVIVTNVFAYFNAPELLLAAANVAAMMSEGGYLLHNEPRGELRAFADALGAPLKQSRTVLISGGEVAPLFDGVAIHRKLQAGLT
jgi:hypothetical protein